MNKTITEKELIEFLEKLKAYSLNQREKTIDKINENHYNSLLSIFDELISTISCLGFEEVNKIWTDSVDKMNDD